MSGLKRESKEASVFIELLGRGFNLSVPADQEELYNKSYQRFMDRFRLHKSGEDKYDDFEAIALAAIESMVQTERTEEQMKQLIEVMEYRIEELNRTLNSALDTQFSSK